MHLMHSLTSWGAYPLDHGTCQSQQLTVEDVGELFDEGEATPTVKEATPTSSDNEPHNTSLLEVSRGNSPRPPPCIRTNTLQPTQTKFIESKMMSNERSQPQPALNGQYPWQPVSVDCCY